MSLATSPPPPAVDLATRKRLARIIVPLRAVFFGGLLCVLDLNLFIQSGSVRHGFDILNDALGMVLIAGGVIALNAQRVDDVYDWLMGFTSAIAIVFMIGAFLKQMDPEWLLRLRSLMLLFEFLGFAATVAFCISMKRLASTFSAPIVERSWRTTTLMFAFFVVFPGVVLTVLGMVVPKEAPLIKYSATLVILGYCVALGHMFVSSWRMSTHAKTLQPRPPRGSVA